MPAPGKSFDRRPIEVWLIDDNEIYTAVVEQAIGIADDIQCTGIFASCEPAFERLRTGELPPHVILLDIGLPGVSGIQAIQTFKDFSARTQIIMLTVFDLDDKVLAALKRGASGYLLKASTTEEIVNAIRSSLQGGVPLDPMVTRSLINSLRLSARPDNKYNLTDREQEVLRYMVEGITVQPMADKMFISLHTVLMHIRHIHQKLGVKTRSQAVVKAVKENLI